MARRFTDTNKWRDDWWGLLSNDYRMIWLYLVDSCSIAGIWKKDFRGLNFNCNTNISEEDFKKVFGSRIIDKGNYYFIPKFVFYQCPSGLNSNKPAIVSIVKELNQYNLTETIRELFGNDYLIIKDKGEDKGKGEGEDKGKGKYITLENKKIYDVVPVLEFYEAPLNGRQKEHSLKDWRTVVPEWFEQHLEMPFNDQKHVLNSFSKYYINNGRPPNGKFKSQTTKLTPEELNAL
jgi:hypothetical protein